MPGPTVGIIAVIGTHLTRTGIIRTLEGFFMTILVTGANGALGSLVVESLLARGAQPSQIVATGRSVEALAHFAERGIGTAELDYAKPETISAALDGVDSVLLVSASVPGTRAALHQNVIDAAKDAGISKLVYTSAPKATTTDFVLAADHKATEEAIAAAGIPAVIVRNNWYTENYAADVARAADTGVITASAGEGRVASATRADYADGAAVVLLEDGHLGNTYEFAGDQAWNYSELAQATSDVTGKPVSYQALTTAEHVAQLESFGLDAGTAGFVAGIDSGIAAGVLADTDQTLSRIIGRPTTPLVEGLRAAIAAAPQA